MNLLCSVIILDPFYYYSTCVVF